MLQIESGSVLDAMIRHQWIFPLAECIHIVSFALAIGTIALVDLSLLGFGLERKLAAQLVWSTDPWTVSGLILILFSGLLLFASDPDHYYLNSAFQFKITCLVLAVLFNFTIHRKVALSEQRSERMSRLVAAVSLVLWISVVFGGLFIAFE